MQLEATQLQIAEDAAQLSKEGKIEFAREKLTKLVTETTDIRILFLGFEFFERTGDLDSAVKVLEKWLGLSGAENRTVETAAALNNLGNLYQTRGELDRAEEMYQSHWPLRMHSATIRAWQFPMATSETFIRHAESLIERGRCTRRHWPSTRRSAVKRVWQGNTVTSESCIRPVENLIEQR